MSHEGPKFNETNVYRVGRMGESISLAFKFAQILSKNGLANIQRIHEENVEREGKREINPKIAITLTKSANFDKLTEGLILREQ